MNEYCAEYTFLIDGATWGREEYCFEADNDEEAIQEAFNYERSYGYVKRGKTAELLLDYLYDPDGNEIEITNEEREKYI